MTIENYVYVVHREKSFGLLPSLKEDNSADITVIKGPLVFKNNQSWIVKNLVYQALFGN